MHSSCWLIIPQLVSHHCLVLTLDCPFGIPNKVILAKNGHVTPKKRLEKEGGRGREQGGKNTNIK